MSRLSRNIVGVTTLLIFGGSLSGCSALLGSRYNNFRAYYNTFYNAKKAFQEGEEAIERNSQRVDRTRFLAVFPVQTGTTRGPNPQFEEAIEKSADLLRERPDSKYADDALLLIGKAYFYQQNYVGARGKFGETIEAALAGEQFQLVDEARFWLGRTLAASELYDEAAAILEEGLLRDGIRDKWRSRMNLAQGELFVQQENWPAAATALAAGIVAVDEGDLASRAQFLLGQVYEANGEFDLAVDAYRNVSRHRPVYEIAYAALLNEALVLGLDADRIDEGLEAIRRMRRDDKNFQNRAEVELVYARLLAVAGQHDDAYERFDDILYGDDFRSSNVRGATYYYFGEYFQRHQNDYVRASVFYDTAATAIRNEPSREQLVTRTALVGVQRKAEVYRSFADIAVQIAEKDSLLRLGYMNEAEFSRAIADIEEARLIAWQEEQQRLQQRRADQGFGTGPIIRDGGDEGGFGRNEGGRGDTGGGIDTGYLNYLDPTRVQDAFVIFQGYWGDRVLAPNWRRQSALNAAAAIANNDGSTEGSQIDIQSGGPPPLDLGNVPRTAASQAAMRDDRAQLRYELGNVMFFSLVEPDSARFWYQRVLDEDPEHEVANRAQYALAELSQSQGQSTQANSLYQQVIADAPTSDLAAQARERLGLPPIETNDTSGEERRSEEAYNRVYSTWQTGDFEQAFTQMLALGEPGASTDAVAPRALFAASEVYYDWARADDFLVSVPFPDSLVPGWLAEEASTLANAVHENAVDAEPEMEDDDILARDRPEVQQVEEQKTEEGEEDPNNRFPAPPIVGEDSFGIADSASTDVSLDTLQVDPNAELPDGVGLIDLYRVIESVYPESEFAVLAGTRRQALSQALTPNDIEPVADSEIPADEVDDGESLPQDLVDSAPVGTFGLRGGQPFDDTFGGFTWRVAAVPSPLAAQALMNNFIEQGYRAAATIEDGARGQVYVLMLGQFASENDARTARSDLPQTGVGRNIEIIRFDELELLSVEDLGNQGDD